MNKGFPWEEGYGHGLHWKSPNQGERRKESGITPLKIVCLFDYKQYHKF